MKVLSTHLVGASFSLFCGSLAILNSNRQQLQLRSSCDPLPLTQETWKKLNLDNYLSQYPGGRNLTVSAYAELLETKNFECGISRWCNAGQMCYPVKDLDWYILFSIQEWNERMNTFYLAIGSAMSLVRVNLLSVVSALFPQPNNLHLFSQKSHFALGAALAGLLVGVLSLIPFFIGLPSIIGKWIAGIVLIPASAASFASAATRYHAAPRDAFDEWAEVVYGLTEYQQQVEQALVNQTQSILEAGISTSNGISGLLSGGKYLQPSEFKSMEEVEEQLRNVTLRMSVSHILKSLNAFVTIGSDPCKSSGRNGAWAGEDVLSYCNANGTMFNIISVEPGKTKVRNHIPHASALAAKFGLTTQYLTSAAIECQENRKAHNLTIGNSSAILTQDWNNLNCVIDLPVCDCRGAVFHANRDKMGTVQACRKLGVPIL
ncbi:hypothetical protein O181_007997 [Austropuccinia psidii MF-1]|uniref:DUF7872 domain-containing protein n=1 Tax=Austropuccinia psidii MF-1 TaxID=1389203 RepID=A0A9Q3GJ08_9BASI|nr:hypothetical protein [Austropuccinia psidii MF-1]